VPLAAKTGLNTLKVFVSSADRKTSRCYAVTTASLVSTAAGLASITTRLGDDFMLSQDIDLSGIPWQPIGGDVPNGQPGYTGHFDGNGHTITIAQITTPLNCLGVFGSVSTGGVIENVHVNCDIATTDKYYVGALVGWNIGTIRHCSSSGTINETGIGECIGGLVGQNGLTSSTEASVISECYSTVNVRGRAQVGGLAGANGDTTGGQASILNSYARGSAIATTTSGHSAGGLVGDNRITGRVANSYATGTAIGTTDAGGLVGRNQDGDASYFVRSYYDNDNFMGTTPNGIGRATAQMKDAASVATTYASWDFSLVWAMGGPAINDGYPYLQYFGAAGTSSP
jgi:hypothetical protein